MKKSFALIFLLIAAAFAAVTWLRHPASSGESAGAADESLQRLQVREFWAAFQEATQRRVAGQFEEAAASYEKTLAYDPDHEESLYYLGNCHFELGDYARARLLYERLLQLNPSSQRALSQLGITLSTPFPGAEPDWERAEAAFRKSIDVNREESGPFLRLGFLELQRDRPRAAFDHFLTAAGFRSPEGNLMAGWVRFRQGEFREAAPFFEKVLDIRDHENKISGRGVASEGDVDSGAPALTPLEAAAVKAETFLAWLPEPLRRASDDFRRRATLDRARIRPCPSRPGDRRWEDLRGVGAADWDGDGDLDLAAIDGQRGAILLRRVRAAFERIDVPALASDSDLGDLVWIDHDGDGDPDLYAVGSGWSGRTANRLLRNDGTDGGAPRFSDVTAEAGLSGLRNTFRALFLDLDEDGRPDLVEVGAGDSPLRLYRNLGNGRFRESSAEGGLKIEGVAVDLAPADFDGDGRLDLFVLRWRRPALLFLNLGGGRFREAGGDFGVGATGGEALSALAFDYDQDGRTDLLVGVRAPWERSLQSLLRPELVSRTRSPRLFRNIEGRRFDDVTEVVGLDHAWGITQAIPLDFDRDGWPDLLFANGGPEPYRQEPSVLLRNQQGQRFVEHARLPGRDLPANSPGVTTFEWSPSAPAIHLADTGCFLLPIPRISPAEAQSRRD